MQRIGVLMDRAYHICNQMLKGILTYASTKHDWVLRVNRPDPAGLREQLHWGVEGILIFSTSRPFWATLKKKHLPVVNLAGSYSEQLPKVFSDDYEIGVLAANHFLEHGFRNFGFVGFGERDFSTCREQGFTDALKKSHLSCSSIEIYFNIHGIGAAPADFKTKELQLTRWLKELPKPAAVFAVNDSAAWKCASICQENGLEIPQKVALLGVDNDPVLCLGMYPHLSSVMTSLEAIGARAAETLNDLMAGKKPEHSVQLIPPVGIMVRNSTDVFAVPDPLIAQSLRFIHTQLHRPINVSDILDQIPLSRRTFERRFKELLGRLPAEEIRNARLQLAKTLLADGQRPISEVARACGFTCPTIFANFFKREASITPSAFRERVRIRS